MKWNWERADWPNFKWDAVRLQQAEARYLVEAGELAGTLKHLRLADREQFTVEAMSTEAVTTSEIEGEILDGASVQSSIRKQLGLAADPRRAKPREQGVAELMVSLNRDFSPPLSGDVLHRWHRMILKGTSGFREIGGYRESDEPMQIISGAAYAPRVHFEAPPSNRVAAEMARFLEWFNATAPGAVRPLPALTRAGLAHLYFESIHPFDDGNGRIGRAISEKALAQALGRPTMMALASTILRRRKSYYAALEAASRKNEVSDWLAWFAGIALEAQRRAQATVDFLIDKTKLLDRVGDALNARQRKALLRMLEEGPEGFRGGLSAGNYATIAVASPATATRDLSEMVDKGILQRSGERRHARYTLSIALRPVAPVRIAEDGSLGSA